MRELRRGCRQRRLGQRGAVAGHHRRRGRRQQRGARQCRRRWPRRRAATLAAYPVSAVNNNERAGTNWGNGGGWADGTPGTFPDWVQITFNGSKTIDRVVRLFAAGQLRAAGRAHRQHDLCHLRHHRLHRAGLERGELDRRWPRSAATTWSSARVSFAPTTTDRIRINITAARNAGSYITEIEAWTATGGPGGPTSTTTTLASSLNPAPAGASVTLTATVTGTNPTGNVGFTDSGNAISGCTAVALTGAGNSRTATCSTSEPRRRHAPHRRQLRRRCRQRRLQPARRCRR